MTAGNDLLRAEYAKRGIDYRFGNRNGEMIQTLCSDNPIDCYSATKRRTTFPNGEVEIRHEYDNGIAVTRRKGLNGQWSVISLSTKDNGFISDGRMENPEQMFKAPKEYLNKMQTEFEIAEDNIKDAKFLKLSPEKIKQYQAVKDKATAEIQKWEGMTGTEGLRKFFHLTKSDIPSVQNLLRGNILKKMTYLSDIAKMFRL